MKAIKFTLFSLMSLSLLTFEAHAAHRLSLKEISHLTFGTPEVKLLEEQVLGDSSQDPVDWTLDQSQVGADPDEVGDCPDLYKKIGLTRIEKKDEREQNGSQPWLDNSGGMPWDGGGGWNSGGGDPFIGGEGIGAGFDESLGGGFDPDPADHSSNNKYILWQIYNIGRSMWRAVVNNQPRFQQRQDYAHALPRGVKCWTQLEGWKRPRAKTFEVNYRNLFGMKVVSLQYKIIYTYGGNVGGVGQYLTNVTVVPSQVNVGLGYKVDVDIRVPNVFNAGSIAEPLAGAEVQVQWMVSTVLKKGLQTSNFAVYGDGRVVEIN